MSEQPYDPTKHFQPPPQQYAPPQAPYVGPQPGQPGPAFFPAQPQPRKKNRWLLITFVALASLGGLCVVGAVISAANSPSSSRTAGGQSVSTAAAGGAADSGDQAAAADPTPAPAATPKLSDFTLTPKITRKMCFGSAGCNIDFEVKVAYNGPPLSDADTWMITFDVSGVDDGPITNSLTVTGGQAQGETISASTSSSHAKLVVKPTGIEQQ